jgi:hypothetical protein
MRKALLPVILMVLHLSAHSADPAPRKEVPETRTVTVESNQREVMIGGVPCSLGTHVLRIGVPSAEVLVKHVDSTGQLTDLGNFVVLKHLTSFELPEHNTQHRYGIDVFPDDLPTGVTLAVKEFKGPLNQAKELFERKIAIGKHGYFVHPVAFSGDMQFAWQVVFALAYNFQDPFTNKTKEAIGLPTEQEVRDFCRSAKCEVIYFTLSQQKK